MKQYGAIFDVDGTILDSMPWWEKADYISLEKLGITPTREIQENFAKQTLAEAAVYISELDDGKITPEQARELVLDTMFDAYKNEIELKPGILQYLKDLKKRGVKMMIATSGERRCVDLAFARFGITDFFEGILTADDVGKGKNFPDIFNKACEKLGTKPEETFVYEDSLHAIQTAKAAGFVTVGIYDEFSKAHWEEIKTTADFAWNDFKMKTSLTIAGSDSSGGAGIQADIKTITANKVYAMSVITALTAQNTTGVFDIMNVTPDFLKNQLDAVFTDIFPDSIKIGMVSQSALISVIAERLKFYKAANIVVDPVMVATSGARLIEEDAIKVLEQELLPLATLVTPNIPEAEILSEMKIDSAEKMVEAAHIINKKYGCAVLCKGGHSLNDANDFLYASDGTETWFNGKRIENPNTHGTGCTLSSAIASNLAKGYRLEESVERAKEYISGALGAMLNLGKGSGPMCHAFNVEGKFGE